MPTSRNSGFDVTDLWNTTGVTQHLGGPAITRRLMAACSFKAGQRVLDAGCGTGYSACLLAKETGAQVTAMDLRAGVVQWAAQRVGRAGLNASIGLVQGDVHALPFADSAFDGIVCESVLAFCDQPRALAELGRVLRPGGRFGSNEMTFLRPPSEEWNTFFSSGRMGVNMRPHLEADWHALFETAGFTVESAEAHAIHLRAQSAAQIEVDGLRRYLTTRLRNLARPSVWSAFFVPGMWQLWREFPLTLGYGLYTLRKA